MLFTWYFHHLYLQDKLPRHLQGGGEDLRQASERAGEITHTRWYPALWSLGSGPCCQLVFLWLNSVTV